MKVHKEMKKFIHQEIEKVYAVHKAIIHNVRETEIMTESNHFKLTP